MSINTMFGSALLGKTKGMRADLLTNEEYKTMSTKVSVKDVLSYLTTETAYREIFTDISVEPNRHNMERILNRSLATDYFKIYRFTTNQLDKLFLSAYYRKIEVQVLKYIIECLFDERDLEATLPEISHYSSGSSQLNFGELIKAKSLYDLIDRLKDTDYYTTLNESIKSESTLFEIETRLDIQYYYNLYTKVVKKFEATSPVKKIVLHEIDLMNFLALYRLKKYYNIKPSIIFSRIIPVYSSYRTKALMSSLINSKDFDEFLILAKDSHMADVLHDVETQGTEEAYYTILLKEYKKLASKNQFSIILALYYLFCKELEVKNLTLLSESIRYKKNPKDILEILYTVHTD